MSQSPSAEAAAEGDYLAGWIAMTKMIRGSLSWSGRERHCAFLNGPDRAFADVSGVAGLDYGDDGRGLVSWYSSHEKDDDGKGITAIYLAELEIEE